jgi:cob(I)alamin adenosyltransferase
MNANVGSGDRGMTSLLSGERVPKDNDRIEACGALDELASVLGAFASSLTEGQAILGREIQEIQGELLHIGAWLGVMPGSAASRALPELDPRPLTVMESSVARMEKSLPPLSSFILPGGNPSAAWAHIARTVCRRAERRVAAVSLGELAPRVLPYLNRLSTYLFVAARYCNKENGVSDTLWST